MHQRIHTTGGGNAARAGEGHLRADQGYIRQQVVADDAFFQLCGLVGEDRHIGHLRTGAGRGRDGDQRRALARHLVDAKEVRQRTVVTGIGGYAFGDIDQLVPIIERVQREGKVIPDLTKIYPRVTFKPKSEWDAGNKGLNEGMTKLLVTLKNEKASIKQQRIEHGMEAKFSKLPSKDLPKGSAL